MSRKQGGCRTMSFEANILMAEDQEADAYLMRWAFQKAGFSHKLFHVLDGQQALDYLSGTPPYGDRNQYPWPDLLLLDLKMPRLSGFDVLSWLQARPEINRLPVVVLTSSNLASDIERARQLGAADYRVKPGILDDIVELARELDARWLQHAKEPV